MTPAEYRGLLLSGEVCVPPAGPRPRLAASLWFAPRLPEKPASLADLYRTGVEAGHVETRTFLAQRIAEEDQRTAQLREALQEVSALRGRAAAAQVELDAARELHGRQVRHLEAALDAARARIRDLEQSTFWRATYPLRVVVDQVKRLARGLRGLPRKLPLNDPRAASGHGVAGDPAWQALPLTPRSRCKLADAIGPLAIAASKAPRVSVIVPTYGQDLHTFTCLQALAEEAARVRLEVIVADDHAPVPAREALASVSGVRFERAPRNLGFLRNCNRAAGLARGEFLLFLNNDAVLLPGALQSLLDVFERVPDAGAVGAKLLFPDGRLQEAGALVWRDGSAWNVGRGEDPDSPEYNYLRDVDYCSAACLMVPAALFRELRGFDEHYVPAYCEDTDLCFRVRAAGRRVLYQPAAEVVHFEGVSHGTDTAMGIKRCQVDNQRKFLERWHESLAGHRVNGMQPRLERDRRARHRLLLVDACMLTPDQDSGSLRTWRMIEILLSQGNKVSFVADNLERREPYISRLQQMGVEVLYAPYLRSVDDLLESRGAEFDVIVLARHSVASRHIEAVRRHAPRATLVFDTIDLHYLRQRRRAALEESAALARAAQAMQRQEIECIERSDLTWVVSEHEREVLADEVPRARVHVLSNIHDALAEVPPFEGREGLLFVGGFRHPPNVDAVLWYAAQIAPLLAEMLPGVTTYVVGSNAPQAITGLEAPGLEFVGYVPDVAPWLRRCRVSVSPLRYGAGVKGKVNQAMAHGLPVVATPASVEGMHLTPGEEVLVAETPRAFAEAVSRLYADAALWQRLSTAGIANVQRHFSREAAAQALEQLFALRTRSNEAWTPQGPGVSFRRTGCPPHQRATKP